MLYVYMLYTHLLSLCGPQVELASVSLAIQLHRNLKTAQK